MSAGPFEAPGYGQSAPRAPRMLSSRLVVTGILTAGLAVLTVVLALTAFDYWSSRRMLLQDSAVEAAIVAENVSAAVMFQDARAANETLAALRYSPMVVAAGIYDSDGVLFAKYGEDAGLPASSPSSGAAVAAEHHGWSRLDIQRPIMVSDTAWGTLYIQKSTGTANRRLAVRFAGALFIALCVMGAAAVMVLRSRAVVRAAESRLHLLAHTDAVTGVGNRHAFNEQLALQIAQARERGERVALVYIDLDNFKALNDTFGHAAGDGLLHEVARRLQSVVRSADIVSRLGGDEFALILRWNIDDAALDHYGRRIVEMFKSPYSELGQPVALTCSVGIATFPEDAREMDALMGCADTAMYRAKELGKNRSVRFDASMNLVAARRRAIGQALRAELETGGGLTLHYQPLLDARTRIPIGAEALLRWTHPELGHIPPLEAVSVAEESGLIAALGYWALRTACRAAAQWQAAGPMRVAVNLSARQLAEPHFLEQVMDILREEDFPPHLLELELTETVLMENVDAGAHTLMRLSQIGIHLAIDDFGTGYSSLAYLRQLPMRRLKIDRSFVKELPQQDHSRAIVNAIIALAHELDLEVTAEGVETEPQAAYLVQQSCDVLQGYLFAKPMSSEDFFARVVQPRVEMRS